MSDLPSDHASRLDALEAAIAHQDRTIAELSDVVAAQWRMIDLLERQVARLRDEFQNIAAAPRETPEPPPPHY